MKHRYIKWTVIGMAVAIVATFGLIRSYGTGSDEDGPNEGQSLREVQSNPTVTSPSDDVDVPTKQTDNQRPGG